VTKTNLWWLGWNTAQVENREAAAGSQLGEGDHWISLDRLLPHHLSRHVGDDVKPAHMRVRKSTHEISSRNL
jgi:hypothetical protein